MACGAPATKASQRWISKISSSPLPAISKDGSGNSSKSLLGGQKENLGLSGFFFSLERFGRLNCSDRSMKLRKEGLPEAGRVSAKFFYRVPMFLT
jgi:hypothetical protein